MSNSINVTVQVVTPEQATEWLCSSQYEYQRPPQMSVVKYYAEEMLRGCFDPGTQIAFAQVNGSKVLVDGQHRLLAVQDAQIPQVFTVKTVHLQSMKDVADAYARTDQGRRRTVSDQYRAWNLGNVGDREGEFHVSTTLVNSLGAAVTFINMGFADKGNIRRMHPDDKLAMMRQYIEAMHSYIDAVSPVPTEAKKPAFRASTLSVALVTFRYSAGVYGHNKVFDFWHDVVMDDGLNRGSPQKLAADHLRQVGIRGGSTISKQLWSSAMSSRYLSVCFNGYMQNKDRILVRKDQVLQTSPFVILGSPFTGK